MAELPREIQEGFLDKLKTAIKTSTAGAKARAAGNWFREKKNTALIRLGVILVLTKQKQSIGETWLKVLGKGLLLRECILKNWNSR